MVSSVIALKKQIEAIEGFLELGMLREAGEEFEKIDPQHRTLVDVMVVQMAIYRRMLMWEQVAIIARAIARSFPDDAKWHLQWAEALNECDEHRQARDVLAAVQEPFADNAELQFTLARLESMLGNYAAVQRCLDHAYEHDNSTRARSVAEFEFNGFWDWLNAQKPTA